MVEYIGFHHWLTAKNHVFQTQSITSIIMHRCEKIKIPTAKYKIPSMVSMNSASKTLSRSKERNPKTETDNHDIEIDTAGRPALRSYIYTSILFLLKWKARLTLR